MQIRIVDRKHFMTSVSPCRSSLNQAMRVANGHLDVASAMSCLTARITISLGRTEVGPRLFHIGLD